MKNTIKNFLITMFVSLFMIVPAFAGSVEIQTETKLYEEKDDVEITDEEKWIFETVFDFFLNNPDETEYTLILSGYRDYNVSNYVNNINKKYDLITGKYPLYIGYNTIRYEKYLFKSDYYEFNARSGIYYIHINRYMFDEILNVYNYINYIYSIIPDLGIYNGMDEYDAVSIINDFIIDTLDYDDYYAYSFYKYNVLSLKKGVCMDYACLFKSLCEGCGIECYICCDYLDNHGWNEVIIDGITYEIDTCHNDCVDDNRYLYMISLNETMSFPLHSYISEKY